MRTQEVTFNFIQETEIKISEAGLENSSAKWIEENSVIVALYGNLLRGVARCDCRRIDRATNQAWAEISRSTPPEAVASVYYALLKDYEILHGMSKGAAQNNLNLAMVRDYKLRVPPLAMQNRIGDVLTAYDDLMENNRRRMALLEESARLLYREWFVHLRFPGHEHTRLINGVPKGWAVKPLEEVADFRLGKMLDEKKPTVAKPTRALFPTSICASRVSSTTHELREMRFEEHELETFGLKFGDIVMCEGGEPPAAAAIWKDQLHRHDVPREGHPSYPRVHCPRVSLPELAPPSGVRPLRDAIHRCNDQALPPREARQSDRGRSSKDASWICSTSSSTN